MANVNETLDEAIGIEGAFAVIDRKRGNPGLTRHMIASLEKNLKI